MIILINGQERLLMDQKLNAIKKEYDCNETNMNYTYYNGQRDDLNDLIEDLHTVPFLSDYKMVVLEHPIFLTTKKLKKDQKINEEIFEKCLDFKSDQVIFIIFYDQNDFDKRKKIVKRLFKEATIFTFEKLNHYKLKEEVRKMIKKNQCDITEDALELLLIYIPNELLKAKIEVEKLCLYTNHITKEAIELLVSKPLEEDVFSLSTAILKKDRHKMMAIYKDLMVLQVEPIQLIALIASSLRLLYQVKLLDRKGYNDKEIGQIIGANPFRLKYVRNDGKDFEIDELLQILDQLSNLDVNIKTGKIDKKLGFELFMLKI